MLAPQSFLRIGLTECELIGSCYARTRFSCKKVQQYQPAAQKVAISMAGQVSGSHFYLTSWLSSLPGHLIG